MKTPDIPQECGLKLVEPGAYAQAWENECESVYYDLETKSGRAALAAYCMAVIDVLRTEAFEMKVRAEDEDEKWFWEQTEGALLEWRAELSRYGGFTQ